MVTLKVLLVDERRRLGEGVAVVAAPAFSAPIR